MHYELLYSCISHIGNIRTMNQDNFICNGTYTEAEKQDLKFPLNGTVSSKKNTLFGIFDGMGGEECGEIASYIAAKEASTTKLENESVLALTEYCKAANKKICQYAKTNEISSMGTTAAMLLFTKHKITLCNIGDSKIFRFSDGKLEQISKDHVVITTFGKKPPLSQNLGIPENELLIEPYFSQGLYKNNDKYLICSDGLTDMLSTNEITNILNMTSTEETVNTLTTQALKKGGKDNITIILIEIKQQKNKLIQIFSKKHGGK